MAESSDNTPIQSRYAEQYAADLKANREEQAKLQGRLEQLHAEEAWLLKQQQNAPAAEEAGAPAEEAASQAVPQPRQEATKATAAPSGAKKPARSKASGKVASAPKKKAAATKATAKAPVEKATEKVVEATKTAEPPLHELVLRVLRTHPGHPHLAREVHTELVEKHGRPTSIQVVRNNLERLVKKGTIEKENKQNSAMYTAPADAVVTSSTPDPAADEVSEKVPADA
ncbi:hypothetical protein OG883_45685 [Streptomyces sp. NBC_01142]|uniref:hypothetical protein n=1 Tax=Streptomyces sp. NBC_01142 TaxID=2975865 RepID=UPI0022580949|nr:hypothetical protein [Streptomyces sp. NBC_01142]MCX4826932.1 hypothetical protein [Streptomyces sp. NBC_01142]